MHLKNKIIIVSLRMFQRGVSVPQVSTVAFLPLRVTEESVSKPTSPG